MWLEILFYAFVFAFGGIATLAHILLIHALLPRRWHRRDEGSERIERAAFLRSRG
jgi:hypothetical protein